MTKLLNAIATLPSTNLRIAVSIVLAAIYVLALLGAAIAGHPVDGDTAQRIRDFLLIMMGLDVVQFGAKRITHKPSPFNGAMPNNPFRPPPLGYTNGAIDEADFRADPNYSISGVL